MRWIFDPRACEQAKSLGAKVIDTGVPAEIAIGQGGYAKKLPEEWLEKEREVLRGVIKEMRYPLLERTHPARSPLFWSPRIWLRR